MSDKVEFMKVALAQSKNFPGRPVALYPFADWDFYYLAAPLDWEPEPTTPVTLPKVSAPAGFVTDLASIPQVFWSMLPPQGRYTYPAIIHDYLYWFQPCERHTADDVFKVAMEEVGVDSAKIRIIYEAVRLAGSNAWTANGKARQGGERRVLTQFPSDVKMTWRIWKEDTSHFQ